MKLAYPPTLPLERNKPRGERDVFGSESSLYGHIFFVMERTILGHAAKPSAIAAEIFFFLRFTRRELESV